MRWKCALLNINPKLKKNALAVTGTLQANAARDLAAAAAEVEAAVEAVAAHRLGPAALRLGGRAAWAWAGPGLG